MSQIMKAYFFCTFLGHNLYFFSRFFVLSLGDEPVATLCYLCSNQLLITCYLCPYLGEGFIEVSSGPTRVTDNL